MNIRTIYFRTHNLASCSQFWQDFLEVSPHIRQENWHEFMVDGIRLGILQNSGEVLSDSGCIPVFQSSDEEILDLVQCAKELGATVVEDCLGDSAVQSITLEDPTGNEFELCKLP